MKWYWVVACDNTVDNPLVVDCHDLKGFDESKLSIGEETDNWDETAWFKASKEKNDGDPDDVLQNHLGLPVFSERLKDKIEQIGIRGIHYLPIKVMRPNGEEISGFSIANILDKRYALDKSQSDFEVFPDDYFLPERRGRIRAVRKAVLIENSLYESDIIRLGEYDVSIYVSQKFKDAFVNGNFTGYSFHEVKVVSL